MTVEYEIIKGKPTNLRPMPLSVVRQLNPGDHVYVWWAKDGDLRDVRVDGVHRVEDVAQLHHIGRTGIYLSIAGGDIVIWNVDLWDDDVDHLLNFDPECNYTEWGGRGFGYFYYPPED